MVNKLSLKEIATQAVHVTELADVVKDSTHDRHRVIVAQAGRLQETLDAAADDFRDNGRLHHSQNDKLKWEDSQAKKLTDILGEQKFRDAMEATATREGQNMRYGQGITDSRENWDNPYALNEFIKRILKHEREGTARAQSSHQAKPPFPPEAGLAARASRTNGAGRAHMLKAAAGPQ